MTQPETFDPEIFYNFIPKEGRVLEKLEKQAKEENIPIIGPVAGKLLYILARAMGAKRVLELGTATGYSSIFLGRAAKENGGSVVTIEWDQATAREAEKNIKEAGLSDIVTVLQGDARENMSRFQSLKFDLVFNDVEKEYYSELLNPSIEILRSGGLMVFDNTTFKTAGDFLKRSYEHPDLETIHLYCLLPNHDPDYDALTFCLKK